MLVTSLAGRIAEGKNAGFGKVCVLQISPRMQLPVMRLAAVGLLLLSPCMGCIAEEQPPHFWRLPQKQGGGILYMSSGRAYLMAHGHVYAYAPPPEDMERAELASDMGVWTEVHIPEVPVLDGTEAIIGAPQ
jgi:hypothetical protein